MRHTYMEILTEDELLRVIHLQTRAMDVLYGCVVEEEGKRISHANYLYALKQECNLGDLPQFLHKILDGCREESPPIVKKVPAAIKESMAMARRARAAENADKHTVGVLRPITTLVESEKKEEEAVAEKKEEAVAKTKTKGQKKNTRLARQRKEAATRKRVEAEEAEATKKRIEAEEAEATRKRIEAEETEATAKSESITSLTPFSVRRGSPYVRGLKLRRLTEGNEDVMVMETLGDGSCAFNALVVGLALYGARPMPTKQEHLSHLALDLRKMLRKWFDSKTEVKMDNGMTFHDDVLAGNTYSEVKTYDEYANKMCTLKTWYAGHHEMILLASMTEFNIHVVTITTKGVVAMENYQCDKENARTIYLLWQGKNNHGHYELILGTPQEINAPIKILPQFARVPAVPDGTKQRTVKFKL